MSETKNKVGTRTDLQDWLKKIFGISYTEWKRKPRDERLRDYSKYKSKT